MASRRKLDKRALRWHRYQHRCSDRVWRVKETPGYYRATDATGGFWFPNWDRGLYRHNPILVRTALHNCQFPAKFAEETVAAWSNMFRKRGLTGAYWAARALREPNTFRAQACRELAELLA